MQPSSSFRPRSIAVLTAAAVLAVASLAGCTDATGPSPAEVAGVYRLELVDGRAVPDTTSGSMGYMPYAGALILHSNGDAERSVTYRDGGGRLLPLAAAGSFDVRGTAVELRLREQDATTWRLRGDLVGGVLTLRYPNPADGSVVERYRRE